MIKSIYLDSRIKNVSDIQSPVRYDDSFIGEVCYFANNMREFEDLESCSKGTLSEYIDDSYSELGSFTAEEFEGDDYYDFFIPEKLLKPVEKKYRPLTNEEFLALFDSGKLNSIRQSDTLGRYIITDIYFSDSCGKNEVYVCFDCGNCGYEMEYLLKNNFEYLDGNEWKKFGVEE